jgi:hypothetical protein
MDTNKSALLDEVWRICSKCANGDIPIDAQADLERLSQMLDNFKKDRFITYGLSSSQGNG